MPAENQDYIGDGVYAEWTGWSIELRVNNHMNPVAVVLEPSVLAALNRFYERQLELTETKKETK